MSTPTTVDIGRWAEYTAIDILRKEGFTNIHWLSVVNWRNPVDFKAIKENETVFVDVKFSKYGRFTFSKEYLLRRALLNKQTPVFLLLLDGKEYILTKLNEMLNFLDIDINKINENVKIWLTRHKKEKDKPIVINKDSKYYGLFLNITKLALNLPEMKKKFGDDVTEYKLKDTLKAKGFNASACAFILAEIKDVINSFRFTDSTPYLLPLDFEHYFEYQPVPENFANKMHNIWITY